MTTFEWATIILGTLGFVSSQIIQILTLIQSRRAAAQSFANGGHIQDLGGTFNGKMDRLLDTNTALALSQGDAIGRANAKLEEAAAAKTIMDDAKGRLT